jgi:hypothetical protein
MKYAHFTLVGSAHGYLVWACGVELTIRRIPVSEGRKTGNNLEGFGRRLRCTGVAGRQIGIQGNITVS